MSENTVEMIQHTPSIKNQWLSYINILILKVFGFPIHTGDYLV
jgi:hypothetical protein